MFCNASHVFIYSIWILEVGVTVIETCELSFCYCQQISLTLDVGIKQLKQALAPSGSCPSTRSSIWRFFFPFKEGSLLAKLANYFQHIH